MSRLFRLIGHQPPYQGEEPHVMYVVASNIREALDEWGAPGGLPCVKIEELTDDVRIAGEDDRPGI